MNMLMLNKHYFLTIGIVLSDRLIHLPNYINSLSLQRDHNE